MRVLLFGSTGMIGGGALLECLADDRVTAVQAISRAPTGVSHPKLTEVLHQDFFDLQPLADRLRGYDACFYCLGVTAVGLDEAAYSRVTYDLTLVAAKAYLAANPSGTFCYISGAGADSSERGRTMWARVKGRTENALLNLGLARVYLLRPGFIQPVNGVRSKTAWYQGFYTAVAPISPLIRLLLPGLATTTAALGRALINAALLGFPRPIITSGDINRLAATARGANIRAQA
jgi:uncharacterized protein YbjT (DUF2867 family)